MGNIISVPGGRHLDTQTLLPWYASRRLDASECARVETHLAECSECRADLAAERRLAAEWASLPMDTEASWLRLRERVLRDDAERAHSALAPRLASIFRRGLTRGRWWFTGLGWGLAVAQGAALVVIAIVVLPTQRAPVYHTLGAAQPNAIGNVLAIFNPETSERRFRETLEADHARIVDGPTASGVYVLHVPADQRSAILVRMRARPDVELAQPIDPGATR